MDNEQHIYVDEALLARYLAGDALPDEAMAVDDWLAADPANREAFRQVERLYGHDTYRIPDAGAAWGRFAASRRPGYRYGWWAAAASVLLCAAFAYQFLSKPAEATRSAAIEALAAIVRDTLPDRSVVTLPPGGRLTFDKRFTPRTVHLEGEAFFDVQPDGRSPFTVQAGEVTVRVLGTSFNVAITPALIQVNVTSGSVRAGTKNDSSVVRAGEVYTYHRTGGQTRVDAVADTGKNGYAYATRLLVFNDAPLSRVIAEVSKTYDVHIRLADPATGECRISTVFSEKPLEYVMDVIAASLGLQYEIKGNNINITGNGCR